jgi:hypothetical protein
MSRAISSSEGTDSYASDRAASFESSAEPKPAQPANPSELPQPNKDKANKKIIAK